MTIMVRPTQEPHPPILYGGRGPRPFRRIGEYCQGYLPNMGPTDRATRRYGKMGEPSVFEGKPVFPWDEEELTGPQRLERDLQEIQKYWARYGRKGKPYVATTLQVQVTDRRDEADGVVTKGMEKEGEDSFRSSYRLMHVDDLLEVLRAYSDVGVDHVGIRPGAYSYEGKTQLENLTHQMDLIAEHVLPKISLASGPIEPFSYADNIEGVN